MQTTLTLSNKRLKMCIGSIDSDQEIEIEIADDQDNTQAVTWITKEQAIDLVDHLNEQIKQAD